MVNEQRIPDADEQLTADVEEPEENYLTEEKEANDILTGVKEVDEKLGGGIPRGSLTLIEGQSGAGKSVLAQQIIWGSLRNEIKTILYTTENDVKDFITQMESLNLNVLDRLLLGRLRVFPAETSSMGWQSADAFKVLLDDIEQHQDFELIVVDSLTSLMLHSATTQAITFMEDCKALCSQGKTIMNVVHSYAFDEGALLRIRSMCDAHLRLRIEEVGDQLIKVLEVGKIRGAHKSADNIISFTVEPGFGMRIIPISRTRA